MQENKRFEVRCPPLWAEIDDFEEPTYEELVKVVKGVGYCDSPNSAERLRNLGYTIRDLYLEKEKEYDDEQQRQQRGKDTSVSTGNNKPSTKNKGKQRKAKASK
jgi:hypothetical protein